MVRRTLAALALACLALALAVPATADTIVETARYYVTQDDCTGEATDNLRLSTRLGSFSGNCSFLVQPLNEVLATVDEPVADTWTQDDGERFILDTSGEIEFEVGLTGILDDTSTGAITIDVLLEATSGQFDTRTLVEVTQELTPLVMEEGNYTFTADIDDALEGVEVRELSATIVIRGVNDSSYVDVSGRTQVRFPHLVEDQAAA